LTLVLASTSPRRYQILSLLNLPFLMVPPEGSEAISCAQAPAREALYQARRKAASLAARFPRAILIGSDTLISLDGVKIGKPRDFNDARDTLLRLRGRTHHVVTAVSILKPPPPVPSGEPVALHAATGHEGEGRGGGAGGKIFEWAETASVTMRDFSDTDLEAYLATGDSRDKAGAYSVQGLGRNLIERLDGDYLTVMGLPLRAVVEGLKQFGVESVVDLDRLYRERNFLNWRTFP
jgi:septum formation protein